MASNEAILRIKLDDTPPPRVPLVPPPNQPAPYKPPVTPEQPVKPVVSAPQPTYEPPDLRDLEESHGRTLADFSRDVHDSVAEVVKDASRSAAPWPVKQMARQEVKRDEPAPMEPAVQPVVQHMPGAPLPVSQEVVREQLGPVEPVTQKVSREQLGLVEPARQQVVQDRAPGVDPAFQPVIQEKPPGVDPTSQSVVQKMPPPVPPEIQRVIQEATPAVKPARQVVEQAVPPGVPPAEQDVIRKMPPVVAPVEQRVIQEAPPSVPPVRQAVEQDMPPGVKPVTQEVRQETAPPVEPATQRIVREKLGEIDPAVQKVVREPVAQEPSQVPLGQPPQMVEAGKSSQSVTLNMETIKTDLDEVLGGFTRKIVSEASGFSPSPWPVEKPGVAKVEPVPPIGRAGFEEPPLAGFQEPPAVPVGQARPVTLIGPEGVPLTGVPSQVPIGPVPTVPVAEPGTAQFGPVPTMPVAKPEEIAAPEFPRLKVDDVGTMPVAAPGVAPVERIGPLAVEKTVLPVERPTLGVERPGAIPVSAPESIPSRGPTQVPLGPAPTMPPVGFEKPPLVGFGAPPVATFGPSPRIPPVEVEQPGMAGIEAPETAKIERPQDARVGPPPAIATPTIPPVEPSPALRDVASKMSAPPVEPRAQIPTARAQIETVARGDVAQPQAPKGIDQNEPRAQMPLPPQGPKEPWQMTRQEFVKGGVGAEGEKSFPPNVAAMIHKSLVEDAVAQGKAVSREILAAYPELLAKAAPEPVETTATLPVAAGVGAPLPTTATAPTKSQVAPVTGLPLVPAPMPVTGATPPPPTPTGPVLPAVQPPTPTPPPFPDFWAVEVAARKVMEAELFAERVDKMRMSIDLEFRKKKEKEKELREEKEKADAEREKKVKLFFAGQALSQAGFPGLGSVASGFAAGPTTGILTVINLLKDAVHSIMESGSKMMSSIMSMDPVSMMRGFGDLIGKIPIIGGLFGGLISTTMDLSDAMLATARRLSAYDAGLAVAVARLEVSRIMRDIERARTHGPELVAAVERRMEFEDKWNAFIDRMMPTVLKFLDDMMAFLDENAGAIAEAIKTVIQCLVIIARVVTWIFNALTVVPRLLGLMGGMEEALAGIEAHLRPEHSDPFVTELEALAGRLPGWPAVRPPRVEPGLPRPR